MIRERVLLLKTRSLHCLLLIHNNLDILKSLLVVEVCSNFGSKVAFTGNRWRFLRMCVIDILIVLTVPYPAVDAIKVDNNLAALVSVNDVVISLNCIDRYWSSIMCMYIF
jgi:hypothetical protein